MNKKMWIAMAVAVAVCGVLWFSLGHHQSRLDKIQVEVAKCQNRIATLNDEWQELEDKQTAIHEMAEAERQQIENLQLEASSLLGVN